MAGGRGPVKERNKLEMRWLAPVSPEPNACNCLLPFGMGLGDRGHRQMCSDATSIFTPIPKPVILCLYPSGPLTSLALFLHPVGGCHTPPVILIRRRPDRPWSLSQTRTAAQETCAWIADTYDTPQSVGPSLNNPKLDLSFVFFLPSSYYDDPITGTSAIAAKNKSCTPNAYGPIHEETQ